MFKFDHMELPFPDFSLNICRLTSYKDALKLKAA